MNILTSLLILGLLIFFHEAGHFLAARVQGISVNGFSIGFGPAIFKKEVQGVTYSLRAFPLGGFVSFPEDDEKNNIPKEDPDLLRNRPLIQRAFVISAGVLANLLLAWLLLIGQATFIGLPEQPNPGVRVLSVQTQGAADNSGLIAGDTIIKIEGIELGKGLEAVKLLVKQIQSSPNKTLEIERENRGSRTNIKITPVEYLGNGRIGAELQPNTSKRIVPAKNINEIFYNSDKQFIDLLTRTIKGYQGLITNFRSSAKQISGPIKIVEIGAQLSQEGAQGSILFAALISINLAVLNSLPLPLLDGGQLMILIIEGLIGKPIPEKIELAFMQSGFLLLVGLSVVLIIRDTSQLSIVQHLINH